MDFNNKLILQWGYNWIPYTELTLTFPITFKTNPRIYGTACGADSCILNVMATYKDRCILDYPSSAQGGCNWLALGSI